MNWKIVKEWVLARLSEKTTWAGLVTFFGSITGAALLPEHAVMITTAGTGLAATILAAMKEKGPDK